MPPTTLAAEGRSQISCSTGRTSSAYVAKGATMSPVNSMYSQSVHTQLSTGNSQPPATEASPAVHTVKTQHTRCHLLHAGTAQHTGPGNPAQSLHRLCPSIKPHITQDPKTASPLFRPVNAKLLRRHSTAAARQQGSPAATARCKFTHQQAHSHHKLSHTRNIKRLQALADAQAEALALAGGGCRH